MKSNNASGVQTLNFISGSAVGGLDWLDDVIGDIINELWQGDDAPETRDSLGPARLLALNLTPATAGAVCSPLVDHCYSIPRVLRQLGAYPAQLVSAADERGSQRARVELLREYARAVGAESELGAVACEVVRLMRKCEMRAVCCIVQSAWQEFCAICAKGPQNDDYVADYHYFDRVRLGITRAVESFVRHTGEKSPGDPVRLDISTVSRATAGLKRCSDDDAHRTRVHFLLTQIKQVMKFAATTLLTRFDPTNKLAPGLPERSTGRIIRTATGYDGNWGR